MRQKGGIEIGKINKYNGIGRNVEVFPHTSSPKGDSNSLLIRQAYLLRRLQEIKRFGVETKTFILTSYRDGLKNVWLNLFGDPHIGRNMNYTGLKNPMPNTSVKRRRKVEVSVDFQWNHRCQGKSMDFKIGRLKPLNGMLESTPWEVQAFDPFKPPLSTGW